MIKRFFIDFKHCLLYNDMDKQCGKCKKHKSLSEFNKNKTHKDGLQHWCKQCALEIAKRWYAKNKHREEVRERLRKADQRQVKKFKDAINYIKSSFGCAFCSEKEPCCLDFHHTGNKEKDREVSYWVKTKSVARICEEMNKCICVCANCHRKLHAGLIQCTCEPKNLTEDKLYEIINASVTQPGRVAAF